MEEKQLSSRINSLLNILGVLVLFMFLFPVYWTTITSLKTEQEIFRLPPTFFPLKINTESYIVQLRSGDYNIFRSFLNSFIISISSMLIAVILAVPASYGLARYQFMGKKIFVLGFLVTQMLPVSVVLTPLFILFRNMHLINSPLSAIFADATIGIPFSILILQNYFSAIPKDIEEAAYIDGCNHFLTFMLILIPVAIPGVIVCAVFSFLYAWGDLAFGMTFIQEQFKRPITSGIFNFIGRYGIQWSYLCAFAVVTIIPVAVIFIVMQKYIISGITSGAVKG